MGRRINPLTKEGAKLDFIRGLSVKDVADKYGLNLKTLRVIASNESWMKEREKFIQEQKQIVKETVFDKMAVRLEETIVRQMEFARVVSQMGVEMIHKEYQAKQFGEDRKADAKIFSWVSIMEKVSRILTNVLPNPDDEMAKKILSEFSKVSSTQNELIDQLDKIKKSNTENSGA